MTAPTREQVEAVRDAFRCAACDVADASGSDYGREHTCYSVPEEPTLALCDLADAHLSAQRVELDPMERARFGTCPTCNRGHKQECFVELDDEKTYRDGVFWIEATHPARLDAAPRFVRLVACDGDGT